MLLLPAAGAADRIALIIANQAYEHAPAVPKALADGAAIKNTFAQFGFETSLVTNASHAALQKSLRQFEEKAPTAMVALIYYSGHGMALDGSNYLVPVDAKIESRNQFGAETISVDSVMNILKGVPFPILILDSCRDNPFPASQNWPAPSPAATGLAPIHPPTTTFSILFSAGPGAKSLDGDGPNSVFAKALLRYLPRRNFDAHSALFDTADDVAARTSGAQKPLYAHGDDEPHVDIVFPLPKPAVSHVPEVNGHAKPPAAAKREAPFVNSLGMKFVPVPGTKCLFSIWQTRLKDYEVFADAHPWTKTQWSKPKMRFQYVQEPDHPVIVSWLEASLFCKWLSQVEGHRYRLPTDREWSTAIGLDKLEDPAVPPRDLPQLQRYPWGPALPPPPGAGNIKGDEGDPDAAIGGYRDAFDFTAPVGSFPPNSFGLFDLGTNVSEWCDDLWDAAVSPNRIVRGGSWMSHNEFQLDVTQRWGGSPSSDRVYSTGFRCVLELDNET